MVQKELEEAILKDKLRGMPDIEIGRKYGVTFRYIEKLVTKTKGVNISLLKKFKKIKAWHPKDFKEEQTTVWSFKQRGDWATHSGEYRGNWSPYIPRNVILKYSKPGELVLDYFCGAGTTAVEAKLLGRRCIAFDINEKAIELAKQNIDFIPPKEGITQFYEPELNVGDARNLSFLESDSIDLICAHPPYANIIHYTDNKEGDLSFLDIDGFLKQMAIVARESYRVLKPGRQCAILIGDTRRKRYVIPLGFKLINVYLDAGFKLKELVIKRQHNCKTTGFWYENSIKYNFLLLAHEYLPIFEKPKIGTKPLVKERLTTYSTLRPRFERLLLTKRLSELESTTVWILPKEDFESQLNRNVIKRYSDGKGYKTINFCVDIKEDKMESFKKKVVNLLFIKSACLEQNTLSINKVNSYLNGIKEVIDKEVNSIDYGGFCVIQTKDIRIDDYIEPLAKKIVDMLTMSNLQLKEIVVVIQENQNLENQYSQNKYLKITHQYLLIYERR